MTDVDVRHQAGLGRPPVRTIKGLNGLLLLLAFALAGFLGALALLARAGGEPIVVMLLALLAALGSFFVFGVATGFVTVGSAADTSVSVRAWADPLPDGIRVTARDGTHLYANAAFTDILGLAADDTNGGLERALAGDVQVSEVIFRLMQVVERGESREEELWLRGAGANGWQAHWLRIGVWPAAETVLWRVADVTPVRLRQEDSFRQLEDLLTSYDRLPVGVLSVAPSGLVELMNSTLAGWLGRDPASLRQSTFADLFAGEAAALVNALHMTTPGEAAHLDLDMCGLEGGLVPVRLIATTVDIPGERQRGLRAIVLRRGAGSLLDADTRGDDVRLSRFLHAAPFGIATVTRDGRIANANAAFARMFYADARSRPQRLSTLMEEIAGADVRAQVDAAFAAAIAGKGTGEPLEISYGPDRHFSRRIFISLLDHGDGLPEAAALYVVDTTEQKALEIKFAQSHKMEAVGQLAGGIAHDFNNVLQVIIGLSELFTTSRRPTDPGYSDVMQIRSEANRAASMVSQLLAFGRKQTLKPEVLALNDVVQDLGYSLNRLLTERIELKIQCERDLWFVKADRTQFEQVLINLAVNARDAMPEGGRLSVRTRNITEREAQKLSGQGMLLGEYVLVEVEDTGTGMSPEVMAKIFEPFFSTKEVGKGTGLGLATVYGIVKQTGGYVYPESEIGKGTTFRVYLPRHQPDAIEIKGPGAGAAERPKDLTGTGRVLLVEDEDGVRNFAMRALQRQGYEVLTASTGVEALEVMAAHDGQVDLVVSDVVMPEMDGPTLLKELRKSKPDLKIIFVSGYADDVFKKSLDANEEFTFLPKPFTLSQLANKVKEALGG